MARATTSANIRRAAAAAAPKKKIGRPLGSKNRVPATAKPKNAAPTRKSAPAPVRMNKAELEAQVTKLERSVARLRTQNAELKRALKDAQQPPEATSSQPSAAAKTTGKNTGSTPVKRRRRTKAEMAAAKQATESENDQSGE